MQQARSERWKGGFKGLFIKTDNRFAYNIVLLSRIPSILCLFYIQVHKSETQEVVMPIYIKVHLYHYKKEVSQTVFDIPRTPKLPKCNPTICFTLISQITLTFFSFTLCFIAFQQNGTKYNHICFAQHHTKTTSKKKFYTQTTMVMALKTTFT